MGDYLLVEDCERRREGVWHVEYGLLTNCIFRCVIRYIIYQSYKLTIKKDDLEGKFKDVNPLRIGFDGQ